MMEVQRVEVGPCLVGVKIGDDFREVVGERRSGRRSRRDCRPSGPSNTPFGTRPSRPRCGRRTAPSRPRSRARRPAPAPSNAGPSRDGSGRHRAGRWGSASSAWPAHGRRKAVELLHLDPGLVQFAGSGVILVRRRELAPVRLHFDPIESAAGPVDAGQRTEVGRFRKLVAQTTKARPHRRRLARSRRGHGQRRQHADADRRLVVAARKLVIADRQLAQVDFPRSFALRHYLAIVVQHAPRAGPSRAAAAPPPPRPAEKYCPDARAAAWEACSLDAVHYLSGSPCNRQASKYHDRG